MLWEPCHLPFRGNALALSKAIVLFDPYPLDGVAERVGIVFVFFHFRGPPHWSPVGTMGETGRTGRTAVLPV